MTVTQCLSFCKKSTMSFINDRLSVIPAQVGIHCVWCFKNKRDESCEPIRLVWPHVFFAR